MMTIQSTTQADIIKFLKELLNPDGFGYSVTPEVRKEAKRLLEIIENEQNPTIRSAI